MNESSDSAITLDPADRKSLLQEKMKLLYQGLPLSLISSLIIGLLLSLSHLSVKGQSEIIIWNLILGATLIIRMILWLVWLNARYLLQDQSWLLLFRIGTVLGGVAWGTAPILIYADNNSIYQALLSFSLAGVVSGSLTSLSADRFSAVSFALLAVFPLTLLIILNDSPTAFSMSAMTILFIIFVISSSGRTQKELQAQIQQNDALLTLSYELQSNLEIDAIVNRVQSQFISDKNYQSAMQAMINETINITKSEMGFIGNIHHDIDKKPYMTMSVFGTSQQDTKYNFFMETSRMHKEFRNLNGLFGNIILTGKATFSNNPRHDIRSIGTPENHPEINAFIGIPVFHGSTLLAVLGLANSSDEFTEKTIQLLTPITNLVAQLIHTAQLQKQHVRDIEVLEETSIQTQTILDDIADGIITTDQYGNIKSFNKAAETIFGYKSTQIIGHNIDQLLPDYYRDHDELRISEQIKSGKSEPLGIGREINGLRRNGKHFSMDMMISRITRNNEPIYIAVVRDISEKKLLQELHKNSLNSVAKELRVPSNTISIAMDIMEKNTQSNTPGLNKNIIGIVKSEAAKLQTKISSLLLKNGNQHSDSEKHHIKASDFFENYILSYKHIAELRGSKFTIANRIYDEHIQVNEIVVENAIIYFLDLAAEHYPPYSEIKIYIEQIRGKIRIYYIDKSGNDEKFYKKDPRWNEIQIQLQSIHTTLGLENTTKDKSDQNAVVVFIDFPLSLMRSGIQ